uniref:Condensation domain-containing protein n=1 Tax=Streptomyces sp. NBC_00003 TaxID=2903608 RepID=A0AAU2V0T1_9ACTN
MAKLPTPPLSRRAASTAPLSYAQERLWFIDAAAPGSAVYNVPLLTRWNEPVDIAALTRALAAVVARHEVLRTTYGLRDGRPVQYVGEPVPVPVEVIPTALRDDAELAPHARAPFDLATAPPLRCVVWQGGPDGDATLLVAHHIAVDGWSLTALYEDLAEVYEQALSGAEPRLAELAVQYADFAAWDREVGGHPAMTERLDARLAEILAVPGDLALGPCPPRRALPEGDRLGRQHTFRLNAQLVADTRELATRLRATDFVVLFAAFQAVVQRWTGQEEFLLGTVAANRPHPSVEQLVGFFVNTVPLRCRLDVRWSFERLCDEVRGESFRALSHQRLPFDQLTARAAADRSRPQGPLVGVGFVLQNMPAPRLGDRPRWTAPRLLPTGTAKQDLTLVLAYDSDDDGDGILATVEYATDRYTEETVRELAGHFQVLLAAAVADPRAPLCRLPLTRPADGRPGPGVLFGEERDLVGEYRERLAVAEQGDRA